MIDHLSQKRENTQTYVRNQVLNNDDINEVCKDDTKEDLREELVETEHVESTNYLSNGNTHTNTDAISKKTILNYDEMNKPV